MKDEKIRYLKSAVRHAIRVIEAAKKDCGEVEVTIGVKSELVSALSCLARLDTKLTREYYLPRRRGG